MSGSGHEIDYESPSGEQLTLENVDSIYYVGSAIEGLSEVIILPIGTKELRVTDFALTND